MAESELGPERPDPEKLLDDIRRLQVSDLLLSALSTVAQLGYAKLDRETRDLGQARLAIDSLRAVLPVLEGAVSADTLRDFRQVVTNLQLAYAEAAGQQPADERPADERPAEEEPPGEERADES